MDKQVRKIYDLIEKAYLLKLDKIGVILEGQVKKRAKEQGIRDRGDFVRNIDSEVVNMSPYLELRLGSNVPHAKYVLGGKVPSATPLKPLKAWVKRKNLKWYDKDDNLMTTDEMAQAIFWKILKKGIAERNVVKEVLDERAGWIKQELESVLDEI
jgi:hypothetical protein